LFKKRRYRGHLLGLLTGNLNKNWEEILVLRSKMI
jgi:hypothetical protein